MSKLFDDFIDGIVKPNRWALVGDFLALSATAPTSTSQTRRNTTR